MKAKKPRVTAENIQTLPRGLHTVGQGLYLSIGRPASGDEPAVGSWTYRYYLHGRQREMGLGSLRDIKTITAAKKARDAAALLKGSKIDPIERAREEAAAKQPKKVTTFEKATAGWLAKQREEWSSARYSMLVERQLRTYALPTLAKLPVGEITMPMVLDILQPHWATKTSTMSKLRCYLEGILDWAAEERLGPNPAVWRGNLARKLSRPNKVHKKTPHAAVDWRAVPQFMSRLRSKESTSARLLEWTVLCAARTSESLYARVGEVNEAERVWVVPPERMKAEKNGRTEHRVPMSDRCMMIFAEMSSGKKPTDWLFAHDGGGHLSSNAMYAFLEDMGVVATVHGFRSSFSTWRFEDPETAKRFPQELVEASLHHKLGNDVELAYQRGDGLERRRELMSAWSTYCAGT